MNARTAPANSPATVLERKGQEPSQARRLVCVGMLLLTVPAGLAWRLAPLHLPPFAFKYGGSALWAMAVYWLVAGLLPRWQAGRLAAAAGVLAFGVELLKLVYWPPLDRFRETLAGKLLLGRYFSLGAIVAYWGAMAAVAMVDTWLRRDTELSERCHAHTGVGS